MTTLIQEGVVEAKKTAVERIKNERGLKDLEKINTEDNVSLEKKAKKMWNRRGAGFETTNFEQKVADAKAKMKKSAM